jgi:hypothetical protein
MRRSLRARFPPLWKDFQPKKFRSIGAWIFALRPSHSAIFDPDNFAKI